MSPFLVATSFLASQAAPAPPVEVAFMSALAAGDAATVEAMLEPGATIMHEESGTPVASTGAAIANFLNGCEGSVMFDVPGDEPGIVAFTISWSCGPRGQTDMLLWTSHGRVQWVQLGKLAPPEAAQ